MENIISEWLSSGKLVAPKEDNIQYLASINNLSSAVVKTVDKTMKITYTLTEEA